jgi:hypothetical protein
MLGNEIPFSDPILPTLIKEDQLLEILEENSIQANQSDSETISSLLIEPPHSSSKYEEI